MTEVNVLRTEYLLPIEGAMIRERADTLAEHSRAAIAAWAASGSDWPPHLDQPAALKFTTGRARAAVIALS